MGFLDSHHRRSSCRYPLSYHTTNEDVDPGRGRGLWANRICLQGDPRVESLECPSPPKIMQLLLSLQQPPQETERAPHTYHTHPGAQPHRSFGHIGREMPKWSYLGADIPREHRSPISLLVTGLIAFPEALAHQAVPTCYLIVLCHTHTPRPAIGTCCSSCLQCPSTRFWPKFATCPLDLNFRLAFSGKLSSPSLTTLVKSHHASQRHSINIC